MTTGLFSSNRPGGSGSDDIYAFRNYIQTPVVPKPVVMPNEVPKLTSAVISGSVKSKADHSPIAQATVFVLNAASKNVFVLKTNPDGYFEFGAENGIDYQIKAMRNGYFYDCLSFALPANNTSEKITLPKTLILDQYTINQTFVIDNIYYDLNKWDIREDAKTSLDKLVITLLQNPINIEMGSHTDCRASAAYNNTLSQKRAESAVKYLIMKGIDSGRLTAKGYGESKLINKCADGVQCSETEHQANRRTEFKITSIISNPTTQNTFNPDNYKLNDKVMLEELPSGFFDNCPN
jgi:outer membrane protein OmpA-like peptidoglycan-associated protein